MLIETLKICGKGDVFPPQEDVLMTAEPHQDRL